MFKAVDIPAGAQLLILPVNRTRVTAGYKNAAYLKGQGYAHYGIDYADPVSGAKPIIYASGDGTVVAAGLDNVLGNTVVVRYPKVYIPATGKAQDLILRYNHMDSIAVKAGQAKRLPVCTCTLRWILIPPIHCTAQPLARAAISSKQALEVQGIPR